MRRAFPQKVKPVPCHMSPVDSVVEQSKQTPQGATHKARTSAAMLGLALSMGASSLLLPRHDDRAAAAESNRPTESEVTVAPSPAQEVSSPLEVESAASPAPVDSSAMAEHTVQDGQTLWKIARRYRVSVEALAAANGIPVDATLRVGQVIRIPVSGEVLSALRTIAPTVAAPESAPVTPIATSSPVASAATSQAVAEPEVAAENVDSLLSAEHNQMLNRLRQQREKLRTSLAGYGTEESVRSSVDAEKDQGQIVPTAVSTEPSFSQREQLKPQFEDAAQGPQYRVKPGDTLSTIARVHNVPQQTLIAVNNLTNPNFLRVNQALTIPQAESPSAAQAILPALQQSAEMQSTVIPQVAIAQPEASAEVNQPTYQVNPGDTLDQIARNYEISKSSLIAANRLDNPNLLSIGQVLRIPSEAVNARTSNIAAVPATPAQEVPEFQGAASFPVPSSSARDLAQVSTGAAVPTTPMVAIANLPVASSTPTADRPIFSGEFIGVQPEQTKQASTIPPTGGPAVVASNSTTQPESGVHVQRLMSEIADLRDSQRSEQAGSQAASHRPTLVAAASMSSSLPKLDDASRINPEFNPRRYNESVQSERSNSQRPEVEQAQVPAQPQVAPVAPQQLVATVPTPQPEASPVNRGQTVATAPSGSENYAPLLQPLVGRMVSPDLPPLQGAEAYLPDGSAAFNGYLWPARGVLTSGYGWRWGRMHRGIDIAAPVGTPVYAAAPGVVEFAGWNSGGYGYMVDIRHPDGSMTRYGHNSRLIVRAGQEVDQGQQIAAMGSTGYSTGPHVHFEIHLPNQGTINPMAMLPRR